MNKVWLFLALLAIVCSCKVLQEDDITKSKAELVSPPDNFKTEVYYQTFYWNKVSGAGSYRLQIATPDFDPTRMQLITDTVTNRTSFSKSLAPKTTYQWRVMALNGGYETEFSAPRTLIIDSSINIRLQRIILSGPANRIPRKDKSITFQWEELDIARQYRFVLDSADKILQDVKVTDTKINYQFKGEGTYIWKVRGEDRDDVPSPYSQSVLVLDWTKPSISNYTSTIGKDSTLLVKWSSADNHGISDEKIAVYRSDRSLFSNTYPLTVLGKTHTLKGVQAADSLFYSISVTDSAGNVYNTDLIRVK